MSTQTVWVLCKGAYSDRYVYGLFSTRELAIAAVADDGAQELARPGTHYDAVRLDDKGNGEVWLHFSKGGKAMSGHDYDVEEFAVDP